MPLASDPSLVLDRLSTPVGDALLVADDLGVLRALDFADHEARMHRLLVRHSGTAPRLRQDRVRPEIREAVEAYFSGRPDALGRVEVRTGGTEFQRAVWAALRAIPPGRTWSYRQLATAVGRPKAVRAV